MPQSANAVWDRAKKLLRERIPEKTVDNWLQEVDPELDGESSEGVTFVLRVPSSFNREYLLSRFRQKIADALQEATDFAISLEVSVDSKLQRVSHEKSASAESSDSSADGPAHGEEPGGQASEKPPETGDRARSAPPAGLGRDVDSEQLNDEVASSPDALRRENQPQVRENPGGSEPRTPPVSEVREAPPIRRAARQRAPGGRKGGSAQSRTDQIPRTKKRGASRKSEEKRKEHTSLFRPSDPKRNLRPEFTFSEFVTGESNRLAHDSSFSIANEPGSTKYNPLVLYGEVGLGKTHLAQAIAHHAIDHNTVGTACYLSSERFTSEFVTAIREDALNEFSTFYRSVDLLVVDDIQFLEGKEKTQEEFFHLFNDLHQSGKQIVLCADQPPARITEIEDRLISRFQWGLSAEIQRPSFEMRVELLRLKADTIGLDLEPSILEVIADSITENVRQLEGALKQLSAHSKLQDNRLEISDAKRILGNSVSVGNETRHPTIQDIIHVVAEYYSLPADDLISRGRHQVVSDARQVAMYLARQLTNQSYASIGRRFGGRDHSTVIHACNKVKDLIDVQEGFEDELESVRMEVRSAVRA